MSLSQKQHKELLDQTLQANVTYKSLDGVIPCSIIIDGNYYNVYIKNLSSAYFPNDDIWRSQLPYSDQFLEMKRSEIPFIFLGYDEENDVYATWNPYMVKQRLNEAKYVSFYSRLSAQKEAKIDDKFVHLKLNNDGEVLIFPRTKLNTYLVNLQSYFADLSDYVAMGSKRRSEANNTYRELNNARNVLFYAKYLESKNIDEVSLYCRWVKYLINQNIFSIHRKDFLTYDSIDQYNMAIDQFMQRDDVIKINLSTEGCLKQILLTYIDFLRQKLMENKPEVDDVVDVDESKLEDIDDVDLQYYKEGKITKITNPEVLNMIEKHLNTEYREPIVAINILKQYYSEKFELKMEFRDWMNLVKSIDWKN